MRSSNNFYLFVGIIVTLTGCSGGATPNIAGVSLPSLLNGASTAVTNAGISGGSGTYTGGNLGSSTGGYMGSSTGGYMGGSTGGYMGGSTGGYMGSSTGGYMGGSSGGHMGSSTGGHAGKDIAPTSWACNVVVYNGITVGNGNGTTGTCGLGPAVAPAVACTVSPPHGAAITTGWCLASGGTPAATGGTTPATGPTGTPNSPVKVSVASMSLTVGQKLPLMATAPGVSNFTVTSSNAMVVLALPDPTATGAFTVQGMGPGTATLTVSDTAGNKTNIPITVQ